MTQVKWKFEGTEVYFVSSSDKLDRDVLRHRGKLGTKAKIEIIDDNFTLPESYTANCASCKRNSTVSAQPTLPVYTEEDETEPEAVQLLGVSVDVDPANSAVDLLPSGSTPSDLDRPSDGLDSQPI